MNKSSSFHSPIISLDLIDNNNMYSIFSFLLFNNLWIFSLFILCLVGILLTIILLFLFLYFAFRRLNDHLILPNLFICFSVCLIYLILIVFFIRGNELFCGLREFLAQFAYALLYSALLCRYIMQWLATRILSKRTKQLTCLLIYLLLIFIQIPIGILWWYFTIPRVCQEEIRDEYPKLKFQLQKSMSTSLVKPCSYQCVVDYRFYTTFTYIILELFLCTIIAAGLFLCRQRPRTKPSNDQLKRANDNNAPLRFFNMFAFILIDIVWLIWTFIYHFTHPFFVFPSLVIGMFTIGTICLFFILFPQIYFYSKLKINDNIPPKITLFTNQLASIDDMKDQNLVFHEKQLDQNKQQQSLSNRSELSYELGMSGTFLPITRTPKGPYKVRNIDKTIIPIEKLDKLVYGEHYNTTQISNNQDRFTTNITNHEEQQLQSPLQRQLTSSSIASNYFNPVLTTGRIHQSNSAVHPSSSMYYSSYSHPHRDETLIPILCTSERHQTSTPVKMRILVKSSSSSVPITRRIHSGADHRYIRHPYHHVLPPPSPATPTYYSPTSQQQYVYVDPYRIMPSYSGRQLVSPASHRYPYDRFHIDNRSLSQRLWDIDSGDDEDEMRDNMVNIHNRFKAIDEYLDDSRSNPTDTDDNILLHIDDEEENSYNKQYIQV